MRALEAASRTNRPDPVHLAPESASADTNPALSFIDSVFSVVIRIAGEPARARRRRHSVSERPSHGRAHAGGGRRADRRTSGPAPANGPYPETLGRPAQGDTGRYTRVPTRNDRPRQLPTLSRRRSVPV